ncbi:hypothetical protein EV421DRAFT_1245487 [Armillaria borealis]|uniref:Transmembrane protein n=1 Tax=Armillaria borealis TaxID=47425 RepID=A0AA39MIU7_9AGAR|nr:hypothetical protein EV421DRAFT_1245487 [Armillaria borealis]
MARGSSRVMPDRSPPPTTRHVIVSFIFIFNFKFWFKFPFSYHRPPHWNSFPKRNPVLTFSHFVCTFLIWILGHLSEFFWLLTFCFPPSSGPSFLRRFYCSFLNGTTLLS